MEATDKLEVTLEAQQWNSIMAILADGPYRVVQPLIAEIQRQCLDPALTGPREVIPAAE